MDSFNIITPVTYWISTIVWVYIFVFYIRKLFNSRGVDSFLRILLIILAIDAFRTVLENFYFGAWFTSLAQLIPIYIYNFLAQPQIVFIPKFINLITALLILLIIIRKWLPMESDRINTFNALLAEKTERIEATKEQFKAEAKNATEIAEHYRNVTINSPFPIMIHAEGGEVLFINNSWKEITGYALDEINTIEKWSKRAYGTDAESQKENIDRLYQIEGELKEGEFTINTKSGNQVIWDFSSALLEKLADGRRMVISTAVDITAKKEVEKIAKEREDKFRNLVKYMPIPLCLADRNGRFIYINDRFTDIFEYTLDDIPTLDAWWLKAYPDSEYRAWLLNAWKMAIETAKAENIDIEPTECQVTCKSGCVRTVLISGITLEDGFLATFLDISKQKQTEIEIKNLNENLESLVADRTKKLDSRALKLKKSQQALTYLLEDVNDIKKQLKISNNRLLDANNELEAFSYSVSHDLKAPLRAIIGFSQIIKEDFAPQLDPESQRYINLIINNAENMGTLINDLLNFSRMARTTLKTSKVDIHALGERVKNELLFESPERKLSITIMDMPQVNADEKLLYHVIQNLMSNAVKFTGNVEHAEVEFGYTTKDGVNVFYVKDNGVGFNMKYAGRIFDVFQRLHTVDEFPGTGIGLSIVQRIIHKHGGKIWVESELNRGATFFFTL